MADFSIHEEWRPVEEWPDYEVSSMGRVRRARDSQNRTGPRYLKGHIIKLSVGKTGYPYFSMYGRGKPKLQNVHRLVCAAFHGPAPSPKHTVAHWNGNRSDNRAENLRWATNSENQMDRHRHGTEINGSRHYNSVLEDADVLNIKRLIADGVRLASIGRLYNVSRSTIHNIKTGKNWGHVT